MITRAMMLDQFESFGREIARGEHTRIPPMTGPQRRRFYAGYSDEMKRTRGRPT